MDTYLFEEYFVVKTVDDILKDFFSRYDIDILLQNTSKYRHGVNFKCHDDDINYIGSLEDIQLLKEDYTLEHQLRINIYNDKFCINDNKYRQRKYLQLDQEYMFDKLPTLKRLYFKDLSFVLLYNKNIIHIKCFKNDSLLFTMKLEYGIIDDIIPEEYYLKQDSIMLFKRFNKYC